MLFDAWAQCEGQWEKSKFIESIRDRHRNTRRGTRKWLTKFEVHTKFGEQIGDQIMARKLSDDELKEKEVRAHPELPENQAWCCVFLCVYSFFS